MEGDDTHQTIRNTRRRCSICSSTSLQCSRDHLSNKFSCCGWCCYCLRPLTWFSAPLRCFMKNSLSEVIYITIPFFLRRWPTDGSFSLFMCKAVKIVWGWVRLGLLFLWHHTSEISVLSLKHLTKLVPLTHGDCFKRWYSHQQRPSSNKINGSNQVVGHFAFGWTVHFSWLSLEPLVSLVTLR